MANKSIEEKCRAKYAPITPNLARILAFDYGYNACNEDVVKVVNSLDGDDGKSGDYYLGYFDAKREILDKLKTLK